MTIEIRDPRVSYRTADGWIDVFTGAQTIDSYPTAVNVGIDAIDGWEPTFEYAETPVISEEGAVFEDVRVLNGGISVQAPNVTIRRCEVNNGSIYNAYSGKVYNNLLIEDSTVRVTPAGTNLPLNKAIGDAGYTARRCSILDATEGFRSGGSIASGYEYQNLEIADPERIRLYDCFVRMTGPIICNFDTDYHGDAFQTFDGGNGGVPTTIRNCTLMSMDKETDDDSGSCAGNSCVIIDDTQSQDCDFDRLLCFGSTIPFRYSGGGRFLNILIVEDSWVPGFFPIAIDTDTWDRIDEANWSGWLVQLDANGQPTIKTYVIPYGYEGFGELPPYEP